MVNVECSKSRFALRVRAYERSPATDVSVEYCTFRNVAEPSVLENVRNLTMVDVNITPPAEVKRGK
jgi:hypothetical protein